MGVDRTAAVYHYRAIALLCWCGIKLGLRTELNIGYPVTGHKTNDQFISAVTDIQKFID